ncbi:MAG: hypothetical protein H0X31_00355 [Nostocaceae cyanobacterium]|nr:hypothetical protein [Nostocaceae cyanobacterium]
MPRNTNGYKFVAAVDIYNDEHILVQFLKNKKDGITEKDKVFGATTAYWRPFAYRITENCSERELKQYARTAIYQLQQHINYIARSFGLEESLLMAAQLHEKLVSIPPTIETPLILDKIKPDAQTELDKQTELGEQSEIDKQTETNEQVEPELTSLSYESLLNNNDDAAIFEKLFPVEH